MLLFLLCIGILPMYAAWYFLWKTAFEKERKNVVKYFLQTQGENLPAHWYGRLPAPAGHAAAARRSQTNPPPRVAAFTIHTKAYQPRIQARRLRAGLFISAQIARNARLCYNTLIYDYIPARGGTI